MKTSCRVQEAFEDLREVRRSGSRRAEEERIASGAALLDLLAELYFSGLCRPGRVLAAVRFFSRKRRTP